MIIQKPQRALLFWLDEQIGERASWEYLLECGTKHGWSIAQKLNFRRRLCRGMGIKRDAVYRALAVLENAGLINVKRHVGRNSIVRILDVQRE